MANSGHNPNGLISYGPNENCTLTLGPQYCPPSVSVYEYRPSLAANTTFLALFGLALVIHLALGIRYKTWAFLFAVFWGCASELIGYGGRLMMWQNPFSFPGFLIQGSECSASVYCSCGCVCQEFERITPDARQSVSRLVQHSTQLPSI